MLALTLLVVGCRRGPSDQEAIATLYRDYRAAVVAGDPLRLRPLLSASRQTDLAAPDAAAKLQLIAQLVPSDPRTSKLEVKGETAVLEVAGDKDGMPMTGTVRLVRESKVWKIDKEEWSVRMSSGAIEAGTFLTDPQQPPAAQAVLEGHQGEVTRLAFTPDGRFLVSASYGDFSIRTWDAQTGAAVALARSDERVRGLVLAPDGRSILTADVNRNVRVWPLEEGRIAGPRMLFSGAGDALALSRDGKVLATAGPGAPIRLWSRPEGRLLEELGGAPNQRTLTFVGEGRAVVSGGDGDTYSLWTPAARFWGFGPEGWREDRRKIHQVSPEGGISSLDVSRDGKLLATGHNDSSIVVFDLEHGRELFNFFVRDAATRDVAWSPDGALLATAQEDHRVYLWDARTAQRLAALDGHLQAVTSLAFSPDGRTLASGGEDRRIILWRSGPAPAVAAATPPPADPCLTTAAPAFVEHAGRANLVANPRGDQAGAGWEREGEAACESSAEGNRVFAIRHGAHFRQDIALPAGGGRYALLIARAASERVDPGGDQTGLPYLYGYMVNSRDPQRINAYLSGGQMTLRPAAAGEWGLVWGVFAVPPETGAVRVFLQQADGAQPQNGSAARFDDVGVFLFDGEEDARAFALAYAPAP